MSINICEHNIYEGDFKKNAKSFFYFRKEFHIIYYRRVFKENLISFLPANERKRHIISISIEIPPTEAFIYKILNSGG